MIISHLGDQVAKTIGEFYNIKELSQGPPTRYLEADTEKIQTEDRREIWKISSSSYITNIIDTVEGLLFEDGKCKVLKFNSRKPFPLNYRP